MEDQDGDETSKYGKPHSYDPDFKGPVKSRSCTDILCLLLYFCFLAGWVVVAVFAFIHGDPMRLLYPTDSRGQVCGRDLAVADKPYLFFFDLTRCASSKAVLQQRCPTPQVCVRTCPSENWFYSPLSTDGQDRTKLICNYDVNPNTSTTAVKDLVTSGQCAFYYVKSDNRANRCIPANISHHTVEIITSVNSAYANHTAVERYDVILTAMKYVLRFANIQQVLEGVVEDVRANWHLILGFLVITKLAALLWIFLLRFISTFLIWFSMVAFIALCGFGGYYSMDKYLHLRANAQAMKNMSLTRDEPMTLTELRFTDELNRYSELETTWLVIFCIIAVVLVVVVLLLIILRKRIGIAVALIGQASKAVADMMSTLLLPIIPYLLQLITLAAFCVIAVYLASTGRPRYEVTCSSDTCCPGVEEGAECNPEEFTLGATCPTASCQFKEYFENPHIARLQIYNVFALFWNLFFISAFNEMVLAGAFASWYWAFDKSKDLPMMPVTRSVGRTLRYHIGTIAFGSLIIAIVRMIRLLFEYIDRKIKEKTDNVLVKCLSCCCRCCLWCLEKFLKFVNRNAYIYCAIYGNNFCSSARKSFSLLMRNILRVVVLDKVTDFLLFIGKLVVTGGITLLAFFVFSGGIPGLQEELPHTNYYLAIVLIIAIVSYFIVSAFFSVYEIGVDTLFLCFLEDTERNDGTEDKPYFMSKDLMKILHKENKFKEE